MSNIQDVLPKINKSRVTLDQVDNTSNDVSFDLGVTNFFKSTPTGAFTLTFTNFTSGRSGIIILDNTGGHAPSSAANVKADADFLITVSAAGIYQLGYIADGTNVYITYSKALV